MEKQIFPASISNLDRIMDYYRKILTVSGISHPHAKKFELALEEATVNIISYAYQTPEGMIEIEYKIKNDSQELIIILKDSGKPFNPCNDEEFITPTTLSSQNIGGLGIHFMKNLVDKIEYSYSDKKNILTLTKNINP